MYNDAGQRRRWPRPASMDRRSSPFDAGRDTAKELVEMYRGRRMRHRWMQDPPDAVSPSRCRDASSEVERVYDDRGDDARRGARANGRATRRERSRARMTLHSMARDRVRPSREVVYSFRLCNISSAVLTRHGWGFQLVSD